MSLNIKGYVKNKARRLLPDLWKYDKDTSKMDALLDGINNAIQENENSRFIVFTRFVNKEAYKIKSFLCENGFSDFDSIKDDENTVKVITGENAYELGKFKGRDNLPRVLVLTYQIAEQGVNLPGFNYVVNYHISPFPSALEQRFGRIDRMGKNGSVFEEIHMCFLVSNDYYDTNTCNFYCAISIYLNNLISYLPSKNTIISEEIVDKYSQSKHLINEYADRIIDLVNDKNQISLIRAYFTERDDNTECKCSLDLFDFIMDNGIVFDESEENSEELFIHNVKECLREFKSVFHGVSEYRLLEYKSVIKKIGDKVFYKQRECSGNEISDNLNMLDAVEECGKYISECDSFKAYKKQFNNSIKLVLLIKDYLLEFNKYFEECFNENRMDKIFPLTDYKGIIREIFEIKKIQIKEEDFAIVLKNCDMIVKSLPFFRMCSEFKRIIQRYVYTNGGSIRIRYDFNPFISAIGVLGRVIKNSTDGLGITKDFIELYWKEDTNCYQVAYAKLFRIEQAVDGLINASNWYKLAYQYLRREELVFIDNTILCDKENNKFSWREKIICQISRDYSNEVKTDWNQILEQFNNICNENRKSQSVFNHYIFTDNNNHRAHIEEVYAMCRNINESLCKIKSNDIWARGICYEIYGLTFGNNTWDEILPLPKEFSGCKIF